METFNHIPLFDFNIHLPMGNDGLDSRHLKDLKMNIREIGTALTFYKQDLSRISSGNFMLFNQHITEEPDFIRQMQNLIVNRNFPDNSVFTLLLDFRHPNVYDHIQDAFKSGVKGIKFHAYLQKIGPENYPKIVEISLLAEKLGMFICIDTSYGTINMYRYDNLLLASQIAYNVKEAPIILLHSGGARAIQAMLMADMQRNIYLETSLTIPYYEGSSLWKDLAFCYKKLNCDRVLYGTDFPYVTFNKSLDGHSLFFREFNFSEYEIEKIMYLNAAKLTATLLNG